jgi:hypothetical protein
MVYNAQDYWDFELSTSSGSLENTTSRKLVMFSSSEEGIGKPTLLVPLETASLSHCISTSLRLLHLRTETNTTSKTLCSLEYRTIFRDQKLSNRDTVQNPSQDRPQTVTGHIRLKAT